MLVDITKGLEKPYYMKMGDWGIQDHLKPGYQRCMKHQASREVPELLVWTRPTDACHGCHIIDIVIGSHLGNMGFGISLISCLSKHLLKEDKSMLTLFSIIVEHNHAFRLSPPSTSRQHLASGEAFLWHALKTMSCLTDKSNWGSRTWRRYSFEELD